MVHYNMSVLVVNMLKIHGQRGLEKRISDIKQNNKKSYINIDQCVNKNTKKCKSVIVKV